MSSYKLTYFNGQGRAEVARLLLTLGDIKFEDVRLTGEQWLEIKPSAPFGQLPILEVDGETFTQGKAISGLIAKRIGRGGKTDMEQARAHMIVDCLDDILKPLVKTFSQKDVDEILKPGSKTFSEKDEERKKEGRQNYCENELPPFLEKFEKMLEKCPSGHFIGDDLTWPDIALYQCLNGLSMFDYMTINTDKYPKVTALIAKVKSNPKIADWISKRSQTIF